MATKTLRPTKAILNLLNEYELRLYKEGYFPEVNYNDNKVVGDSVTITSFNYFERIDVSKLLFKCLHLNMVCAGIQYGAFTRKSSKSFLSSVTNLLSAMTPVDSSYLKKPAKVICPDLKLWGIEDKFNFRCGRLSQYEYMPNVFDVQIDEENGYAGETGSAYIWEVAMINVGGTWRPFHLSEKEKNERSLILQKI